MNYRVLATLLILMTALAGCSVREISILESRLRSDPDRYSDWTIRVHLRGGLELVPLDAVDQPTRTLIPGDTRDVVLRLQKTTHDDPVVSCAVEWGFAGGMPSSVGSPGGFGGGMPPKRVPIHRIDHIIELGELEFVGDQLIAWVPVSAGAGHRYFVRRPGLECHLQTAFARIHPGYQQLNDGFWVVIPHELIYRFSGLDPTAAPAGAAASSDRRTGGIFGSGLGVERPGGQLDAPGWALRRAASSQDSLALADLQAAMTEITRNEVIPHDALFDHFAALLLIHVARGEEGAASNAAAHLMHFEELELDLGASPAVGTPLANFYEGRGDELRANWPTFLRRMQEWPADCVVEEPAG